MTFSIILENAFFKTALPCFIGHFVHQWLDLILQHRDNQRWTCLQAQRLQTRAACEYTCGVVSVVVLLIVSSICAVCTSRVSNWCSNLSISAVIWRKKGKRLKNHSAIALSSASERRATFSKFIDRSASSMLFTTPAMDFVTWNGKSRQPTRKQKQGGTDLQARRLVHLFHRDGSLDPWGHRIHPSAHPQEIHGLVLLSDGVLCVDPRHFHISLLDSLGDTPTGSTSATAFSRHKSRLWRFYSLFLLCSSLPFLLYHTSWSFFAALWWRILNWTDALWHGVKGKNTPNTSKTAVILKTQPASLGKYHWTRKLSDSTPNLYHCIYRSCVAKRPFY